MVLFNRFALAPLDGTGIDHLFRAAEDMAQRAWKSPASPMGGYRTTQAELEPTENGARLTLVAPGYGPEHVTVNVQRDTVVVRGERQREGKPAVTFQRTVRTPFPIDADAAVARVEHGLIEVDLPRHASETPRAIRVEGAAPAPREIEAEAPEGESGPDA